MLTYLRTHDCHPSPSLVRSCSDVETLKAQHAPWSAASVRELPGIVAVAVNDNPTTWLVAPSSTAMLALGGTAFRS